MYVTYTPSHTPSLSRFLSLYVCLSPLSPHTPTHLSHMCVHTHTSVYFDRWNPSRTLTFFNSFELLVTDSRHRVCSLSKFSDFTFSEAFAHIYARTCVCRCVNLLRICVCAYACVCLRVYVCVCFCIAEVPPFIS